MTPPERRDFADTALWVLLPIGLAVVLLTDNNWFSIPEQAITAGVMLSVVAVAYLLMLAAGPILKVIGVSGAAIVSRVMGMILGAVAVDHVIAAVIELIATTTV